VTSEYTIIPTFSKYVGVLSIVFGLIYHRYETPRGLDIHGNH